VRISCIIPVFNGMRDLNRAVESALAQDVDLQVVLVDDCSTDGSAQWIVERARRDPRVVAITLPANHGQGYARNLGVAAAEAPYVTFLDQDDEHAPGWYEYAVGALDAHPQYAAVRGEIELMELPPELAIDRKDPRWPAIVNSPIWNVVMRKVVYQAIGGSPSGAAFRTREGNEDWVLTETVKRHFLVAIADRLASRHYVQPNGATAYFLRRTRPTAGGFEFIENSAVEKQGALAEALRAFQARADANIATLRPSAPPPAAPPKPKPEPEGMLARVVRKVTGA
jgi:glycosyltransferase involved in cell wall biosynthesis